MNINPDLLQPSSILGYLLVFFGGVITSIGPCNVAMIPLIIGYIGGSQKIEQKRAFSISLVFAVGLAVTFVALGLIASLLGGLIGGSTRIWYYVVALVCIVIGLQMLEVVTIPTPGWFSAIREKVNPKGLLGAFLLGLVSGLVASQCATPVLAAILTYVMAEKSGMVYGATLLFIYALGRGVPIVLAGTFTGVLKNLKRFSKALYYTEKVAGVFVILVGLYFLWIA